MWRRIREEKQNHSYINTTHTCTHTGRTRMHAHTPAPRERTNVSFIMKRLSGLGLLEIIVWFFRYLPFWSKEFYFCCIQEHQHGLDYHLPLPPHSAAHTFGCVCMRICESYPSRLHASVNSRVTGINWRNFTKPWIVPTETIGQPYEASAFCSVHKLGQA